MFPSVCACGLLGWFFKQNDTINGFSNAFWSGVTTLELALTTEAMIEQDITGLYQLCPDRKISKYELLKLFAIVWEKEIEITANSNYKIDKSLICTRKDFKYPSPEYKKMLNDLKFWMDNHSGYYSHYNL